MEEDNANQPSGSGANNANSNNNAGGNHNGVGGQHQHQGPSHSVRVRRPSASIISSTTPMFQPPQNPVQLIQRHRQILLHNQSVHNNSYSGSGDADDEPASSSSSSSSLRGRLSAGIGGSASGNSSNRPASPLGSPDSTAYWGPSPSPASHHSYRAPLTPGGMCVVSSSTSDDIPQSPFSPEDLGGNSNHAFPQPSPADARAETINNHSNNAPELISHGGSSSSLSGQIIRRRPTLASSSLNLSLSTNSGSLIRSNIVSNIVGGNHGQNSNPSDLNQNMSPPNLGNNNSNMAGPSSGILQNNSSPPPPPTFNISPLRNKIKKASSFERFSLAQAAIISNANNNAGGNNGVGASSSSHNVGNSSTGSGSEPSISSIPPTTTNSSNNIGTNSSNSTSTSVNASTSTIVSRAIWDPSPSPSNPTTISSVPPTESTHQPSTSALRSFTSHGLTDKFHIKYPSKKLAAKIASSVYEQEKLNEELNNATLAAAEAISVIGSVSKRSGLSASVIASVAGPSSVTQTEGLIGSANNSNPPSTLAQILNQSSNIHINNMVEQHESIMNSAEAVNHENFIRELGEAPLNLTEHQTNNSSMNSSGNSSQSMLPQRNPVISSRGSLAHKKIPLTPKQKLLHRLQSGELMSSLSPPPQPIVTISQQITQQQQSLPVQTIQQTSTVSSPVVTLHQNISINSEGLQTTGGVSHVTISNNSVQSPPSQQQLDQYAYDSLLRSSSGRDDFVVQDSLGKVIVGSEDPNAVSNMLNVYDPVDAYSYYQYQNILADEIFAGNNSGSASSRQLLMMPSSGLPDAMDQPQGPLEFVLGLGDDHDGERGRDEEMQLNNIDPNDTLSAIKSQGQTDSTLRNLLMMDNLRNNHSADDGAWLSLAAAEYQSRINPDSLTIARGGSSLRGNNSSSSTIVGPGGNIGTSSSSSGVSVVSMSNSMGNSWVNEWPRTSSWQSHPGVNSSGGVGGNIGVQDEVMDMSMMDHVKGPIQLSNQMKRLQVQMQANNGDHHDHDIDEMDLANGLPMLSQMSVNMPIDLQNSMSILPHGPSDSAGEKDTLPMDLQQHHRMDIDDEPVNLMAVNMDQDQGLGVHHHSSNSHLSQSLSSHHQQQLDKGMQNNSSYALQIHNNHSPPDLQQNNLSDLSIENGSGSDNIDERRIIRAKKNKESLIMGSLNETYLMSSSSPSNSQDSINIIMDKPVLPKSIASLPSVFRIARISDSELAVFNSTEKNISTNCRLGPVEGPLRKADDDIGNMNAVYPSLVMMDSNNDIWQLDRSDDEFCNWMKFVRLAHSIKDQNALIVENGGYLYFMTCKDIPPNTELQVGYSYDYAHKYGLPYLLPSHSSLESFMDQYDGRIISKENTMALNLKPSSQQVAPPAPSPPMLQSDNSSDQECIVENDNNGVEQRNLTIETYPCFECDQEFSLLEDLQGHLAVAHREDETIRKPKKKAIKKFQFPDNPEPKNIPSTSASSAVKEPSQTMNADSSTVMESGGSQRTGDRPVGDVGMGKQQDNSVTTGVGQPSAPPKVKCTMCYKSFATKERLEKHMIVHSDESSKPLKCPHCSKRFLTNSALAGHTKTHAEEGKFFECPMCSFSTPQLLQLKEHVQSHKNRESGLFFCPKCPKKFSAYSMIRKHIRAFHGPRQFTCNQCPMSFPTSDKLKLHQLKHSDHREFLCAQCGKQFKRKDKLREHTKRIHETKKKNIVEINIPKDKNSKKFIPKVAPEEYQKFPFKCQDCMVGFKRRGMLVNHMAKKHPDKKIKSIPELNQPILRLTRNYPCLYCERGYKSSSKRKSHILKAHPGRPVPPQLRGIGSGPGLTSSSTPAVESSTSTVNLNDIRPTAISSGTIVQTLTEDGDPRSGIMNVSCTNNVENNLVSTTSNSSGVRKEPSIVGKVAALPHACQWCYREYATRAKLLQHQRKAHINLMPEEMQTPRTQKNNVLKSKKDRAPSIIKTEGMNVIQIQSSKTSEPSIIIPDSTSTTAPTTSSTIQTIANVSEGFNEGNVIGYLLTTANGDLGNLLPSELVMLGPVHSSNHLGNNGGSGPSAILHQSPQSLSLNSGNPNNIAIIATNNSNSKNSNT